MVENEEEQEEEEDDGDDIDDKLMDQLENSNTIKYLIKNCSINGLLVDKNSLVWDKDTRKPYGRYNDGKVSSFNNKELRTVEAWAEANL